MKLTVTDLVHRFTKDDVGIETTKDVSTLQGIIGQDRASRALSFGLRTGGTGFNIFAAGEDGIGKMTSVRQYLEDLAEQKDTPPDCCYVHNFDEPYEPKAIQLPAGTGNQLRDDMSSLVEHVKQELPQAFESDEYSNRREEELGEIKRRTEELSSSVNKKAEEKGFRIQATPMGVALVPVRDGQPLSDADVQELSDEEREKLENDREELQEEIRQVQKEIRDLQRQQQDAVKDLDKQVASHSLGGIFDDLFEKYGDFDAVVEYLEDVREDILDNLDTFKMEAGGASGGSSPMEAQQQRRRVEMIQQQQYNKYRINVAVDNSKSEGAPVVVELNPTYNNLIGRIEKEFQMGALNTDFSLIKAGALARANGGFLVIPAEDILRNYYSWEALKRALKGGNMRIEDIREEIGLMTIKSLRPQPVELSVKVVLIGRPFIYYLLHAYDKDFPNLFKVKADFDTRMKLEDDTVKSFVQFIATYCQKESLRHLNAEAVARLLEHATRMAEHQQKLSTEFGYAGDIIREADFWAGEAGADTVEVDHVRKALQERVYRSNLLQERVCELIDDGTILIETDGSTVAQVNGLSILDTGEFSFGRPSRITATVAPGRKGVIDLEREAELGGPVHSKGVLILSGLMSARYAEGHPLSLSARIVFEQSYSGVDGDSASLAELFAVLSALSDVPLSQGIAVTGSVNQRGQVQAVGGINDKIEGFYDICQAIGVEGEHGVVIPKANVRHMALRDDVRRAVEEDRFSLWAIETVDEGLDVLADESAESVNEKVRKKLESYESTLHEIAGTIGRSGEDRSEGSSAAESV